jgi:fibronectin-binding autotransporter adhesin
MRLTSRFLVLASLAIFSCLESAAAKSVNWDTSATSGFQSGGGTWDVSSASWSTDGVNLAAWVAGDIASFSVGSQGSTDAITVASRIDVSGLSFGGGAPYAANWSISGAGRLNLVADADITLVDGSAVSLNTVVEGGFAIRKLGAGNLTLGAANLFGGGLSVEAGQVTLANAGAAGTGAIVLKGGSLGIASWSSFNLANAIRLEAPSSILDFSGTYYQSSSPYTVTLAGGITGVGGLVKTGTGNIRLENANGYSGGTSINAGWLTLYHGSAAGTGQINLNGGTLGLGNSINVANGINLQSARSVFDMSAVYANGSPYTATLSGVVSGVGTFVKAGAGDVRLNGVNVYSGGTIIEGGYLTLANAQAAGTGEVKINGGTLNLLNISLANTVSLATAASFVQMDMVYADGSPYTATLSGVVSGSGTLVKTGRGDLKLSGSNTYTGGSSINAGCLVLASSTAAGTGQVLLNGGVLKLAQNLNVANAVALQANRSVVEMSVTYANGSPYSSTLSGVISGAGTLVKVGAGELRLSGASTYTGGTSVEGGYLTLASSQAAGTGEVKLAGGTLSLLNVAVGNAIALSSSSSTVQMDLLYANGSPYVATLNGVVSGSGTLVKTGRADLKLNSANTYTGGTMINAGRILVAHGQSLGTGAVTFNGGAVTLSNNVNLANAAQVVATQGEVTVEGTASAILSGGVSGSGTLLKSGAGTLVLAGNLTSTGGLSVAAGSLVVQGMVGGPTTVASGALLAGTGSLGTTSLAAGAELNPGAIGAGAIGQLTVSSLLLNGGSTLRFNLAQADQVAGVGYDLLRVTGSLDLSAANPANKVKLALIGTPSVFNASKGYQFNLIGYGSLNLGANTNITDVFDLDISGLKDEGGNSLLASDFILFQDGSNGQVSLSYNSPIPEPSTYGLALGAMGLAICCVRRRRRSLA